MKLWLLIVLKNTEISGFSKIEQRLTQSEQQQQQQQQSKWTTTTTLVIDSV